MPLAIAIGGALGSVARYLLGSWMTARAPGFPWGTLLINVGGSLLIGLLFALLPAGERPLLRAGLTTGFCGGFTTFSTFSAETLALADEGRHAAAAGYVAASVALGIAAAALGLALGRAARPAG